MGSLWLRVGVLLIVSAMAGSVCWGAAEGASPYGMPVQVTAYDVTLTPDFEANTCRVEAECRLRNFGAAPAATTSLYVLGPEATGTEVTDLEFEAQSADGAWGRAAATDSILPFVSWDPEMKVTMHQVALPRPLAPGQETTLRVSYTLRVADPAKSNVLPALPKEARELLLMEDYGWLPNVPAGPSSVLSRYGRDQYDITYKPAWTVAIRAPAGHRAVAIDGEAASENVWRSRAPGYPQVFVGRYQLASVEDSGVAVDIYSPPGAHDQDTLVTAARTLAEHYRIYTDAFGPLRGARVNVLVTACPDFGGHGGYLGFSVEDGPNFVNESTLAHELAHSWWGHSVTGYGVGTKFLRESLSTWSQTWATAKVHGGAAPNLWAPTTWRQHGLVEASFASAPEWGGRRTWPQWAPTINRDPRATVGDARRAFEEGAGLVAEISAQVGEPAFLGALRTFATRYENGYCTLDEFLATLEESTGRDFAPLFDQTTTGLDTRLHSFYVASDLHSRRAESGWETEVTVLNKGTHETVCPVELHTASGTLERTIQVPPGEVQALHFTTDAEVKSLVIDPRWEALPVVGERDWRGVNLPSDDPWELARRMTPESMGGYNWDWYLQALAFAHAGRWQECADTFTRFEARVRASLPEYSVNDMPVYPYLRGVALLHLGKGDEAAAQMPYVISDLLDALAGREEGGTPPLPPMFSFKGAGLITDERDLVFANHLLKLLTGQDFGFDPKGSKEANAPAVAKWQAWWKEHRSSYQVPAKLVAHPDVLVIYGG